MRAGGWNGWRWVGALGAWVLGGCMAVLEIPTGPPVRGRQLWRTGNFLLILLQFYVNDLRLKPWGPTTFLSEFQTLVHGWDFFLNSVAHVKCSCNSEGMVLKHISVTDLFPVELLPSRHHWWWVNIGSCNGLVPDGTKPLHDPILTQTCEFIIRWVRAGNTPVH